MWDPLLVARMVVKTVESNGSPMDDNLVCSLELKMVDSMDEWDRRLVESTDRYLAL